MAELATELQEATGQNVKVAFVDQGCRGSVVAATAAEHGIRLEVVKLQEAKQGHHCKPR